ANAVPTWRSGVPSPPSPAAAAPRMLSRAGTPVDNIPPDTATAAAPPARPRRSLRERSPLTFVRARSLFSPSPRGVRDLDSGSADPPSHSISSHHHILALEVCPPSAVERRLRSLQQSFHGPWRAPHHVGNLSHRQLICVVQHQRLALV